MSTTGIILIDDYGLDVLPGVEHACEDFLAEKPEVLDMTGYPDSGGVDGGKNGGGIIQVE